MLVALTVRSTIVSILSRPASREQRENRPHQTTDPAVSILSRPASREQPAWLALSAAQKESVSILSRPASREQPTVSSTETGRLIQFQSSPGPRAGSNAPLQTCRFRAVPVSILSRPASREQLAGVRRQPRVIKVSILSRPASREQPTRAGTADTQHDGVSILSRPASREQLLFGDNTYASANKFQSSPGPRAGSNPDTVHDRRQQL